MCSSLLSTLATLALASFTAGCGEVEARQGPMNEPGVDTSPDTAADTPSAACTYVPATSKSRKVLSYTFTGGAFERFGCKPIDPTYWMSGSGMSVTVTFAQPQTRPSIRVWGLNTDDKASVFVNGAAYPLDPNSAFPTAKVVCGISPGQDGVAFVNWMLTGANTPEQGNYSFQDIVIKSTKVTSIRITGLSGAGWGFAGASVGCADGA